MSSSPAGAPTVVVVDDSPFFRHLVRDVLETDGMRVVGEAADGWSALNQIEVLRPDLVTLDIVMPGLGGLDTLGLLMRQAPRPVVMLSAYDERDGADLTIRALELGAVDFVRKPSWSDGVDEATLRARLVQAARAALGGNLHSLRPLETDPEPICPAPSDADHAVPAGASRAASRVLVFGASTGGPKVLSEILPRLPGFDGAATVIVQHMPPGFTDSLARRLAHRAGRSVREARDGERLDAGRIYVAPGGRHLRLVRERSGVHVSLIGTPPVHGVRPSVDVTLESSCDAFGAEVVAVVLTGMGRDGASGCRAVRAAGGRVVVQEPSSCVVSGMPHAVLAHAGADMIAAPPALPLVLCDVLGTPRQV